MENFLNAFCLIVFMEAQDALALDFSPMQELSGSSGVFGQNEVGQS
jgi:hypothetical protein